MIEVLIIGGLIILIVGLICLFEDENAWAFPLGVLGAYLSTGGLMMLLGSREPTAMDVYKGKTTLEITYRDSVPVDSIVVFKNKEK